MVSPSSLYPDGANMRVVAQRSDGGNWWFNVRVHVAGINGWCLVVGLLGCMMGVGS